MRRAVPIVSKQTSERLSAWRERPLMEPRSTRGSLPKKHKIHKYQLEPQFLRIFTQTFSCVHLLRYTSVTAHLHASSRLALFGSSEGGCSFTALHTPSVGTLLALHKAANLDSMRLNYFSMAIQAKRMFHHPARARRRSDDADAGYDISDRNISTTSADQRGYTAYGAFGSGTAVFHFRAASSGVVSLSLVFTLPSESTGPSSSAS